MRAGLLQETGVGVALGGLRADHGDDVGEHRRPADLGAYNDERLGKVGRDLGRGDRAGGRPLGVDVDGAAAAVAVDGRTTVTIASTSVASTTHGSRTASISPQHEPRLSD